MPLPTDECVQLTDSQQLVRNSIRNVCADFDTEYWRSKAEAGEYPHEFVDTLAERG